MSAYFKFLPAVIIIVLSFGCKKNSDVTNRGGGNNSDVKIISNVKYGFNTDINGNKIDLLLDVYIPASASASDRLPFVLFVHGGGFTAGDKSSADQAMKNFVAAGYIGVTIDYRINTAIDASTTDPCEVDSTITQKTVYMSVQDAKAAMRFMVANAATYNIDVSRIFMAGHSAGAITVLNAYYLTQNDFNKIIPGVESELGGVDNADNNYTNSFNIIGMASNSGSLPNPSYITSSNVVPTIFFHGGIDSVIPVQKGHAYYCPNTMYIYGSEPLYQRVTSLGEPAVFHLDPNGVHGPFTQDFLNANEICFFNSVLSKKVESGLYSGLDNSSCP